MDLKDMILVMENYKGISRKLNVIVYETQQSADSDGLAFKQSIAKSKQCCHAPQTR